MDKQLDTIYDQIKERKISQENALKKIEKYRIKYNQKVNNSSNIREENKAAPVIEEDLLQEKAVNYFKKLLSSIIKLPVHRIEADASMEQYGIDSIMVMQLTNQLEKTLGSLPKTLFFEYQNIKDLTGYFVKNYRNQLLKLLEIQEKAVATTENTKDFTAVTEAEKLTFNSRRTSRFAYQFTESLKEKENVDIAIIGVSGRYPQAKNIQEFWYNLRNGKDCITEIPKDRWNHSLYFDEDKNKLGKTYSKWGGFIEGVDQFDPLFFNISPREAEMMDPQERLFLECVYETLEDAGYTRETLSLHQSFGLEGNVGVYVGVMYEEYQLYGAQEQIQGRPVALTGSQSSIANRVSYFCNFHGPSMAVDTMCSSSLTAIHLACQSLQRGGCELAIAGGVNVSIHPNKYLMLGQGKFVSSKGQCESFGEGGDGYVPGEGVGAVLLKPLSKAIADGDHIYGIIKGSTINHGGKTNGYTVPNPNAQAEVIQRAFKEAKVDPRTISYIEAHGTGTSLGDPIEIVGLSKAFQEYTKEKQFCAIGSAKSNIGHCESAAGIAAVTKVLLQLKHRKLVPSLHSDVLNPNIDFSNSPFVVQQELTEWKRPIIEKNGEKREYPRIAGISSFGAGGSNAHIVIEEYIPKDAKQYPITITPQNPAIIVLSAKNEERLQEQAQQLLKAIQEQQFTDNDLADMAYTLQIGREAMEERLAIIVASIKELEEKLDDFAKGQENIEDLYRGQVKRNKETLAVFAMDEEMQEAIEKWIQRRKYAKLLDLWVKGLVFDWNKLYNDTKPNRISLPTYPFARERYWVPETKTKSGDSSITTSANAGTIHPLLHQNTSDLSEQRFSSTFTGQEFFLTDHVVKGQSILPGVAYLEMARAAVEQASGILEESQIGIRLRNVVWARPIAVEDKSVRVHIGLYPEEGGEIAYEIYSQEEKNSTEPIVYSQGIALLSSVVEAPTLDLSNIQAQCNQNILSSDQCYEAFKSIGIEYGDGHRGIEQIHVGSNQVLAKLRLPSCVADTLEEYMLHPSLMDSALQASIGLMMIKGDKNPLKLSLPFALQELEIFKNCTREMWALVGFSDGSKAKDKVQKFDITMCDEQGEICVQMKGFSTRGLEGEVGSVESTATLGTLMLHPYWKEQTVSKEAQTLDYAEHVVILCQSAEATQESIENHINGVRCLSLQAQEAGIEAGFQSYAIEIFEEIQSILKSKPTGKVLVQIVISPQEEQQLLSGLSGLLKTAQLENPKILGQLIEIEADEDLEGIIEKLQENSKSSTNHVRYQKGKRYITDWNEIEVSQESENIPWKEGGIYLITGGAGGLGRIFAEEILQKFKDVTLILTGRSPLKEDKHARLKELERLGGRIEYKQVDVTQKKAVISLIQSIQEDFGSLDGIIHSAGVIRDNFIIKKTKDELEEVLAPKVTGLVNLDEASKDLSLDFFIFFSSAAGAFGNAGQADYATANAFMDAYAKYRNALVVSKQRQGQTLSINWPLWKEGGMQIDAETEKMMQQSTGIIPMQTTTGIWALYQGLASRQEQVMVMEGNLPQMRVRLLQNSLEVDTSFAETPTPQMDIALVHEKTLYQLKRLFGEVTKLSLDRIDPQEPLESYGIDSIMITQLNQKLVSVFGELSKTLFYEYQTLDALTEYFIADYPEKCFQWTGLVTQRESVPEVSSTGSNFDGVNSMLSSLKTEKKTARNLTMTLSSKKVREPIAIIGISGRYPQAKNLEEFWKNLCEGKDCISEIPKERWSIEGFYHPNPQEAVAQGKSYSKWGGFIDEFADFDPLFFNISPREAFNMDPQERLIIESCWQVLEDAGYTREQLTSLYKQRVGVFTGITKTGFALYGPDLWKQGEQIYPTTSFASVANRVSYLLNLKGPSMPIDTMCSASLTAIHEACEHLYHDECEIAIAAGVNLYLHPMSYIQLSTLKMLAADGKCKSFGQGGSGFVPGEGVGAVLLKPLSQAISDQDHIYAVIRGSSINHGGKTNGYTVPNPSAQGELIRAALDKAETDARAVSYIEAHGTGTELGDPIEITGLSGAFRKDTQDTGFCAIGSVKSNIGHLEAAAGIAGLTKIILQMKNQKIVPSLHAKALNPNINFTKTPFVVQQELTEWKRPMIEKNGEKREYPRIAGISSFGAGGSNAHIVIEEYIPKDAKQYPITITPQNPAIIVLSAKNEERLQEQAQQLLKAIQEQQFTDNDLADMAYTLQIGREAMEERLAIIVASIKELEEKLESFVKGQENIEDLYRGQVKRNKETLAVFAMDEEMQETIEKWIQRRKYAKLLDLWVKGLVFDWNKLYNDTKPSRISLPTYPFARERYWIPETKTKSGDSSITTSANAGTIHPLLHQNTSDLSEQRFSSTFTGQEFFLADHRVKGQGVLPRVAYLEMARAAVEQGTGILKESQVGIRLKNIVWSSAITVEDKPFKVNVGLYPEDSGEIAYEIYSQEEKNSTESIVYSQGIALLSSVVEAPTLDLSNIQAACNQNILSSDQCYEAFKSIGIEYGDGHRGIEKIYVGSNQVLAKLTLPSCVVDTLEEYMLHPSLMDSALQASIGLMMVKGDKNPLKLSLPFALQELEIFKKCTREMWVLLGFSDGSKAKDKVQKFDIAMCDEQGKICVRMKGLETKESTKDMLNILETKESSVSETLVSQNQEPFELMTFEEIWQEQAQVDASLVDIKTMVCFLSNPQNQQTIVESIKMLDPQIKIIFISQNKIYQKQSSQAYQILKTEQTNYVETFQSILKDYGKVDTVLYLWALEDSDCIQDYSSIVYILQAINSAKLKPKRLILAAEFNNALERCYLESWIGFERSLGFILPNTQVTGIYKETCKQNPETVIKDWLQKIWIELQAHKAQSVLYQEGKRHICQIHPTTIASGKNILRKGGTYLITGGCGGLGLLFAEHLAKVQPVNLILTGRSAIDDEKQAKIKALEDLGCQVMYVQADICNEIRMKEELIRAKEHFGVIHGVIHAAGIESTQNIFEKEIESFAKVLDPKIRGTMLLDDLLQAEALDFICYFSSSSAILGDFGSCDYAIGNRFQMAYAHNQNQQRHGKVIAINWPLWKDGGMGSTEDERIKMYLKSSGQRFLEVEEGLAVFDRILSQDKSQHLILVGQRSRVQRFLGLSEEQSTSSSLVNSDLLGKGRRPEMKGLSIEQCLQWDLKEFISKLLKIPRDKLDEEGNLVDFGFDSISLTEFANLLTNHYKIEITPALFFGYSTLEKLAQYFATEHQKAIQMFYKEDIEELAVPQNPQIAISTPKQQISQKSRFIVRSIPQDIPEPIAIVGMSGRFPNAYNIDEMWRILSQGQEVIQEISEDRFPGYGSKWKCGLLPGVDEFDPLFFEISPKEAEIMDPRQRLLMQECWKALEDAGYGVARIKTNKIGMFVGAEEGDYRLLVKEKNSITSSHNGILAARFSYFLNLNGPNMAINTACSSGLVAVHQACLSLRNHECDTAIAAGVNLILTPEMFEVMKQSGMLSESGRCFAFDNRADGMVPGEAVAVVVLKPLSQAKVDGDQIYAVIKGSGINSDGKTNGITAPNGSSQTELLKSVYQQYHVNPEEIEYIVTHGTGTKLGDPVEINALYDAFKNYTEKENYCAITSTKTNLGHTLAASGLVSLISLVQALRYETIPASLHCEQENEYINWRESPFYVNKTNKHWSQTGTRNRTGAVSAFGMSGTNVHMVVQSYFIEETEDFSEQAPYFLLVLSAKTPEALQKKIDDMIILLQKKDCPEQNLAQISYTLLEGRQHFKYRCAIVVQDCDDAMYIWKQVGSKEKPLNLFQGKVSRDLKSQKIMKEYAQDLIKQSCSLKKNKNRYQEILYVLADFYCQGYELSWSQLFGDTKPRHISLPTYPFARERYWVPETKTKSGDSSITTSANAGTIHPLLHQNTSDLSEQRFSSTFTGQEFFLTDHVVKGQSILPGVAYLEMARAAVEQASGILEESQIGIRLRNVVWARPIAVEDKSVRVHIGLYPEEGGEIAYEIYSQEEKNSTEPVIYSQGIALLSSVVEAPTLDLSNIQAQCNQNILSSHQCYEAFKSIGIEYGDGHRGIEQIHVGSNQVLAKLRLPSCVADTLEEYMLHPSLMDSALQASIGLIMLREDKNPLKLSLPFALQELEIFKNCTREMWALVGFSDGSKAKDKVQKFDITMCDEQGEICVQMKGFSTRGLEGEVGSVESTATLGTLMLHPYWKEQTVSKEAQTLDYAEHVVILCQSAEATQESIENHINEVRCLSLQAQEAGIEAGFQSYAIEIFEEIQSILKSKPTGKVLVQIVISPQEEQQLLSGLSGLLKTAQLENPKILGQLIEIEADEDLEGIIEKLQENSKSSTNHVRYQKGKRYITDWNEIEVSQESENIPWKEGGIYLITGGAGGLGRIFAEEILQKFKDVTLILTGRSPLKEEKEARLKELERLGGRIEYKQVDVTQKKAVISLIQSIQEDFGSLDGIIHSAGVIRDNFIIKKTKDELEEVLAPKVTGLVNLDEASKDLSLDFFIFFSSAAGAFGNAGQADYATANAFMDAYAKYRNALVASKQRQGQTLSINWPLWKEGGMQIDAETEKMMQQSTGIIPMQTTTGIRALYQGLASRQEQVMVMEGNIEQFRHTIKLDSIEYKHPDDRFYRSLLEKILKDELALDEFEILINMERIKNNE
ncbi:SDR family NAD(P)-dependent oxidoreductase [Clostridium formicaceticum]|uniref:Polyketide synthase PksN n=1 Tax=Clostridium formicaceticum TaxID=1497 RepID=A0AAC9RGR4_9CLOT|nr:SDR family NAD(P)-dependent oxidoreductase [Clostridium formicaceticum]ARE86646.1 Polyketide synthase PksN [Clostridium formicaceticum]